MNIIRLCDNKIVQSWQATISSTNSRDIGIIMFPIIMRTDIYSSNIPRELFNNNPHETLYKNQDNNPTYQQHLCSTSPSSCQTLEMSKLTSFFSSSNGPTPFRTFVLRSSPMDSSNIVVHPLGYPADVPPLYTIVTSHSKPHVSVFQGYPDPRYKIGDATMHTFSSMTDVSLRGQRMRLKESQLSGNFNLDAPIGRFKWVVGKILGSSMELRDSSGTKLASLRSAGFPGSGERKLEIFIQCDNTLVELMVLSGFAAKKVRKDAEEVVSEVVQAVVGAWDVSVREREFERVWNFLYHRLSASNFTLLQVLVLAQLIQRWLWAAFPVFKIQYSFRGSFPLQAWILRCFQAQDAHITSMFWNCLKLLRIETNERKL